MPKEDEPEPGLGPDPQPDPSISADTPEARAQLFYLCANELRRMAEQIGRNEVGHTLQPTALINQMFVKLFEKRSQSWTDRAHFLRFAARTMRSILVDHKKRKKAIKNGGACAHEPLDEALHTVEKHCNGDVCAVHEALQELEAEHPEMAEFVSLRFFGGCTNDEASKVLGFSARTGTRHWKFAGPWLARRLAP
jgi:RNA polymerase sigma factor (TIGR02999 family)